LSSTLGNIRPPDRLKKIPHMLRGAEHMLAMMKASALGRQREYLIAEPLKAISHHRVDRVLEFGGNPGAGIDQHCQPGELADQIPQFIKRASSARDIIQSRVCGRLFISESPHV
jgi:hypothetical protein